MITAVDTNVLLDLLAPDPLFGPASADAVRDGLAEGSVVACAVVWTELAANFPSSRAAEQAMSLLGLGFSAITPKTAFEAGRIWKQYRQQGGQRTRVAADFLIGAHALCQADRLLTRDQGFFRSHFKGLSVLQLGKVQGGLQVLE